MNEKFYKHCAVPMCTSTSKTTPEKIFISVPRTINMRKKWLQLANKDPALFSTQSRMHFCEDHFDLPYDMENYTQYRLMGSVVRIRMRPDCLPSRFNCQPDRPENIMIQQLELENQIYNILPNHVNETEQKCYPEIHPGPSSGKKVKFTEKQPESIEKYVTEIKKENTEDENTNNVCNSNLNDERTCPQSFMDSNVVVKDEIIEMEDPTLSRDSSNHELEELESKINDQLEGDSRNKNGKRKRTEVFAKGMRLLLPKPTNTSIDARNLNTLLRVAGSQHLTTHRRDDKDEAVNDQEIDLDDDSDLTFIPGITYDVLSFQRKLLASMEYSYNLQQGELINNIDQMSKQAKTNGTGKVEIYPNSKIYLPLSTNIESVLTQDYDDNWHALVAYVLDEIYGNNIKHMSVKGTRGNISIDKKVLEALYSLVSSKSTKTIPLSLFNAMVNKICTNRRQLKLSKRKTKRPTSGNRNK